ncbi:amidohydrolase [Psychrosphaera ytuae]|uniref:Amidohydrolase n=1 Tax=Psychrosphaera ytuae TaxID=2820710 RepID=A0A975HH99_9GAMM|nr:amidohydrolase [Psychrosphaera ytuae]QTH62818.1 amidohydrolase [Psychrosphaera ytuae]
MKTKIISITAILMSVFSVATNAEPTVITNVKGYTYTTSEEFVTFDSIAFEDGKILAVGDKSIVSQYPDAKVTDGKGKTMLPGIIDGHGHMLGLGFNQLNVDVRDLKSAQETAKKVAQYAAKNPQVTWIKGRGWNQEIWPENKYPTAKQLDEYISDRPVYLSRVDGHAAWLNTKAMELAGITRNSISPEGGEIIKDKDGNPTGVLIDNAEVLVMEKIPAPSQAEMALALNTANDHLLSLGVTSMHDAGIDLDTYNLYRAKADSKELDVRIYGMLAATDPNLELMLKQGYISDENDFLSIRSVKIYGDGALGSRGAALLEPYHDDRHNQGLLVTSKEKLTPLFDTILAHRFQINIHAIGDRANRIALDEFERVFKKPESTLINGDALRHRVEHAQVVHPEDIPRFKTLNIIPSMQPTHATSDKSMAPKRIGEARLKGAYAWQSFLKQGSKIVAGSDFPVELANPFFGVHAAVARQDRDNQPQGGWIMEEAMTVKQALKAFTIDAAFGAHQETKIGGLQAGKWADFILLDQDIFAVQPKDLWKTRVLETWVAGKRVFKNKSTQ